MELRQRRQVAVDGAGDVADACLHRRDGTGELADRLERRWAKLLGQLGHVRYRAECAVEVERRAKRRRWRFCLEHRVKLVLGAARLYELEIHIYAIAPVRVIRRVAAHALGRHLAQLGMHQRRRRPVATSSDEQPPQVWVDEGAVHQPSAKDRVELVARWVSSGRLDDAGVAVDVEMLGLRVVEPE